MVDPGFAVAYGGFLYLKHIWDTWRAHKFGIYGIWGVGKTTLSRQLSTSGELEDMNLTGDTATEHPFDPELGRYLPPPSSRKRIALKNTNTLKMVNRTILSTDIGGQMKYFSLWLEDMVGRNVEAVIWLVDHRHLANPQDTSQVDAFNRFVECIVSRDYGFETKSMKKKAKTYRPAVVGLVANKADVWLDENWENHWNTNRMSEHPIFEPFKPGLARLQREMIPTIKRPVSALRNWSCESTVWDIMQAKI